ncbi:MAG: hypothetical protein EP330_07725 [Deltaproteobacteria bacterium]|nr:MAG: hypothetical protein EP330_07725 [Deltaproteobacteria bacterium]
MALLVDIARAAQMGQVGPKGLTRGLSRAAKAIDEQRRGTTRALATAAASALPEGARLVPPQPVPEDPLWEAWADQRPLDALPWLASSLTGWERDAAIALTRLGAGELGLADELAALCPEAPAPFVAPLAILRDAALLYEDRASEVDTRARAERALETRNGLLLAEAAITQMEAQVRLGDLAAAETHRATVGKQLYHLGAYAGFSLLARWSPPDTDDDDPELPA